MSTKTLMTVAEFAQLNLEDTEDFELVEGELMPLSSATPLHARICGRLIRELGSYFDRQHLGEALGDVDCQLSSNTVRRPDVAVFLSERLRQIDLKRIPIPFPPDIAVEVLSPSELAVHVNRKALEYLRSGSQEVWLLDPENGEVFVQTDAGMRLLRGSDLIDSPLLPGFTAKVSDLLG